MHGRSFRASGCCSVVHPTEGTISNAAFDALRRGESPEDLLPFAALRAVVGFDDYDAERLRYAETPGEPEAR